VFVHASKFRDKKWETSSLRTKIPVSHSPLLWLCCDVIMLISSVWFLVLFVDLCGLFLGVLVWGGARRIAYREDTQLSAQFALQIATTRA